MDTLTGMRTFSAVVESGSFTRASERLGISRALTSKYVGQLEEYLGVRLLNRTTRRLSPTEAGLAYHQRCRQLLDDLDELESAVRQQQSSPQGLLRVAAPTTFGEIHLTPMIADYLRAQPGVSLELVLADRFVNLVDEGFDLAVRIGDLADSSLIAKRLTTMQAVVSASPDYLASAGLPSHPRELSTHSCIIGSNLSEPRRWVFRAGGERIVVKVDGRFIVNSAQAVREMMLAGAGIGYCPRYAVERDLQQGSLQMLLQDFGQNEFGAYVVYPHNRHLAAKVRSFVDFLSNRFASDPGAGQLPLQT